MSHHAAWVVVIAGLLLSGPAEAQPETADSPDRPRPASNQKAISDRTRQDLVLSGSMLGGYDDNLSPAGADVLSQRPSGYVGVVDVGLSYASDPTAARAIRAAGRGFMNTFRNVGLTPAYGGAQSLAFTTPLGGRTAIKVDESVSYLPLFALAALGPDQSDANLTNGLTKNGSWLTSGSVALAHRLTARSTVLVDVSANRQAYSGGGPFNTEGYGLGAGFDRSFGPRWGVRLGGRRTRARFMQSDAIVVPLVAYTGEAGIRFRRRLSPSRAIQFSAGVGVLTASSIDALTRASTRFTSPSGYGDATMDLTRSWDLLASFQRTVTAPGGINAQPFVTNTASAGVTGPATDWLRLRFSGGYQDGSPAGGVGRYRSISTTVETNVQFSERWSLVTSLSHFHYTMDQATSEILGVAPRLNRKAVRIGASWELPVVRSYSTARRDKRSR